LSAAGFFTGMGVALASGASAAVAFLAPLAPIAVAIIAAIAAIVAIIAFIKVFVGAVQEFGIVNGIFMGFQAVVTAVFQTVVGVFTGAIATVIGFVAAVGIAMANGVAAIVGGVLKIAASIAAWAEKIMGVPPIFSNVLNKAANIVLGFVGTFTNAGKALMGALANGVKSSVGAVSDAVSGAMSQVRSFLPFSDAKVGPLSDLTYSGASIPRTMAEGIRGNIGVLENTMVSYLPNIPEISGISSVSTIPEVKGINYENNSSQSNNSMISDSPITVNIALNGAKNEASFVQQLRAEGAEIARIVEKAMQKKERTKYMRA